MNDERDIVDRTSDKLASRYERILSRGFAEKWFQWVEWVTLTAALWAVGEKSGAIVVRILAVFSAAIVFFKAWLSAERFAKVILPHPSKLPRLIVALLTFLVVLIPLVVMHFISEVIKTILK